jgi:hypothetical protein
MESIVYEVSQINWAIWFRKTKGGSFHSPYGFRVHRIFRVHKILRVHRVSRTCTIGAMGSIVIPVGVVIPVFNVGATCANGSLTFFAVKTQ